MKRNVSVMCVCFVAISSLVLELLKKCQVWYVVGHPTLPFCNASRHIILPFCHTITKDQSNDITFGHMQLLHVTLYTIINLCDDLLHQVLGILKFFTSSI